MARRVGTNRRRIPLLLLALFVIASGTVYLASNEVARSYTGLARVSVSIPTTLVITTPVNGAKVSVAQVDKTLGVYHFIHVAAVLTKADGTPITNETILFTADTSNGVTAGSGLICAAQTDNTGAAGCPSDTKIPTAEFSGAPSAFVATFQGRGPLQAATANVCLDVVGAGQSNSKCP